jgi:class 3 adenylate cyclase/tetratricopeptide (TPR) repeat protein
MTRCSKCGTENPAQFHYCGGCGTTLGEGGCPSCGFANPDGQRFCGRCGAALTPGAQAGAPSLDERKLATVLFADVVGFTSLAEDTDPETLAHTVDTAFRQLGEVIVNHGGTVDKYMGDCLMALFGVPVAHDDDAERAVAAALAMRELGGELRFSIGINSGEVMVSAVGRDGDVTAMGDTVNVAARLEKAAGPGEVLVGQLTAELVAGRVVLQEREPTVLKGKRDPVPVFEALAMRPAAGTPEAAEQPPLVGRDAELDFLMSCWRRATTGRKSGLVLLTGDPGVGKTRLIDGLIDVLGDDARLVRVICPAYGGLSRARVAADLARQLGLTKHDHEAPSIDRPAETDGRPVPPADPGPQPADELWRMRRILEKRAAEQPLLIVFDDIHHAAASDLDPLAKLMARMGGVPLLLVLVGRTEPAGWLGPFVGATTLHLDTLAGGDAQTLASALVGDLPLEAETAQLLATQAGGNPLHLREIVRLLQSGGRLVPSPAGYRLVGPTGLPPSLHAVLSARIDALNAVEKAALQSIAIFSDGATADQIEALGLGDARSALDRLVTAGFLRQSATGSYEIVDPLLREVAYETVPRAVRGERHRRAAAATTAPLARSRHLDLAVDYLPGDETLRGETVNALVGAAFEVYAASRLAETATLLGRAVELGYEEPEGLLRLAKAQIELGRQESAMATLDRIYAPDGDDAFAAELVHTRGNALIGRDPQRAIPLLDQAAEEWQRLGNLQKLAWAMSNKGAALFDLSRFSEAATCQEMALQLFREAGDASGAMQAGGFLALSRPEDPRVPMWLADGLSYAEETGDLSLQRNALLVLAWFHFLRARLGADEATMLAAAEARQLAAISAELGDPVSEVQARCLCAILARITGDLAEGQRELDRAQRVVLSPDTPTASLLAAVSFGGSIGLDGDADAVPPEPSLAPDPVTMVAAAVVAEALLLVGRTEEALARLRWLEQVPPHGRSLASLLDVTRMAALVILGRFNEAAPQLDHVRETASVMGATSVEVAATALLAEVEARRGDTAAAQARLDGIASDPGGVASVFIERARTALGTAGARERLTELAEKLRTPGLCADLNVAAA